MNEPIVLALFALLLATLLYVLSPHRNRHWVVLVFLVAVFFIAITRLSSKPLFFFVAAVVLWIGSMSANRKA